MLLTACWLAFDAAVEAVAGRELPKGPRGGGRVLDALASAVANGLPERGPRGGAIWTPRYLVRRVAWHVLDHAWEIEDRTP